MSQALQCAGFVDNELLFIMVEARSPRNPIQARLYLHFSVRFFSILRSRHKYALSGYLLLAGYHGSHKIVKQTNVDSAHHLFHFHHDFDSSTIHAIFRIARSFSLALSQSAHHYHLCHHLYLHYLPLIRMFAGKNVSHLLFAFSKRYWCCEGGGWKFILSRRGLEL